MIRLDVQDYCQECPMFEAVTDCLDVRTDSVRGEHGLVNRVVRCERAEVCREIHKMFEKQNDKCQGFMGPTF